MSAGVKNKTRCLFPKAVKYYLNLVLVFANETHLNAWLLLLLPAESFGSTGLISTNRFVANSIIWVHKFNTKPNNVLICLNITNMKGFTQEPRARIHTPVSYTHLDVYKRQHLHTMRRLPFHYPPTSRLLLTADNLKILNFVSVCIFLFIQSFKETPSFISSSLSCLVNPFTLES